MNIKFKTSLLIIVTLIAGVVIGAMLNRVFLQNRVQRVFQRRAPNVFVQSYVDAIKPDQEQQKQIQKILDAYAKRMSEIREKNRQDLETLMDSMHTELESVLSPEQMERLSTRPPVGSPPSRWRPVEGEIDFLSRELDLTEDQSAQIKKILEEFRRPPEPPEMKPTDKMRRGSPEEMASFFKEQREKMEQEIQNILTDEQKKKYEEIKRGRSRRFRDTPF
jgi:Spy/CpxP family protein refolding chaperone